LFVFSLSGVCRAEEIPDPVKVLEDRFIEIYKNANPSVVGIRVEIPRETWLSSLDRKTQHVPGLGGKASSAEGESSLLGMITRSLPGNQAIAPADLMPAPIERHGTGLIYDLEGDILTTYEVVRDVTEGVHITVVSSYDTELPAELYAADPYTNLAVLRCPNIEGVPAKFADRSRPPSETDAFRPGSFVFCISRPYGLPNSAYYGIICGTGRQVGQVRYERLIQTTIPLYPGSHGAPLLVADGTVIGILSSTLKHEGWEGVSFAIPADQVREIADKLIERKTVVRGFLGVRVANSAQLQRIKAPRFKKLYGKTGAVVTDVVPDSPAAKAGIQDTDLIISIGGTPVQNWEDLVWVMHRLEPGTDTPVVLERDGKTIETTVSVGYLPSRVD
jgi:S1-C subfamily serine protease